MNNYRYYRKGRVKQIIKSKDEFIAKVSGSEEYKVTIVLYCLKNNDMQIRENNINIKSEKINNFQKFKKEFKREYNKLFHNRSYLHQNELEEGIKYKWQVEGALFLLRKLDKDKRIYDYQKRNIKIEIIL